MIDINNIVDELSLSAADYPDHKHIGVAYEDAQELQKLLSPSGSQEDKQKRVDEFKKIIGV